MLAQCRILAVSLSCCMLPLVDCLVLSNSRLSGMLRVPLVCIISHPLLGCIASEEVPSCNMSLRTLQPASVGHLPALATRQVSI